MAELTIAASGMGGEGVIPAPTEAASPVVEQSGLVKRTGSAILHLFTEQIQAPHPDALSEHFGHASKRNDLQPAIVLPVRRLIGRH